MNLPSLTAQFAVDVGAAVCGLYGGWSSLLWLVFFVRNFDAFYALVNALLVIAVGLSIVAIFFWPQWHDSGIGLCAGLGLSQAVMTVLRRARQPHNPKDERRS